MIVASLLAACAQPTVLAGCDRLSGVTAREDCRLRILKPVFDGGQQGAFDAALRELEDPVSRDLVRLRLAVANPADAGRLCHQVETRGAQEKCRQVLGRPHLGAGP